MEIPFTLLESPWSIPCTTDHPPVFFHPSSPCDQSAWYSTVPGAIVSVGVDAGLPPVEELVDFAEDGGDVGPVEQAASKTMRQTSKSAYLPVRGYLEKCPPSRELLRACDLYPVKLSEFIGIICFSFLFAAL